MSQSRSLTAWILLRLVNIIDGLRFYLLIEHFPQGGRFDPTKQFAILLRYFLIACILWMEYSWIRCLSLLCLSFRRVWIPRDRILWFWGLFCQGLCLFLVDSRSVVYPFSKTVINFYIKFFNISILIQHLGWNLISLRKSLIIFQNKLTFLFIDFPLC